MEYFYGHLARTLDERRFTQAKALVNRAMPKGMFGSILRRMASSSPQPYKRRR